MKYEKEPRRKLMPDVYKDILLTAIVSATIAITIGLILISYMENRIQKNCDYIPLDEIHKTNCGEGL